MDGPAGGGGRVEAVFDLLDGKLRGWIARAFGVPAGDGVWRHWPPREEQQDTLTGALDVAALVVSPFHVALHVRRAMRSVDLSASRVYVAAGPCKLGLFPETTDLPGADMLTARLTSPFSVSSSQFEAELVGAESAAFNAAAHSLWWMFYDFPRAKWLRALAQQSGDADLRQAVLAGGLILFERPGVAVVLLRPALRLAGGRLHCADGPAVRWPNGEAAWFWQGVRVPHYVVEQPERITLADIAAEPNSEVKRVLIERYGWERFDAGVGPATINDDERWGTLCRLVDPLSREALLWLRVVNRSPEPDGSFRRYVLPVHPELRPLPDTERGETQFGAPQAPQALTALNAVASTFGMRGEDYAARLRAES